jgi:hypothetical protein
MISGEAESYRLRLVSGETDAACADENTAPKDSVTRRRIAFFMICPK